MLTTDANKAIVRRWFAELDRGNLAVIEELIPEDYIDHNPAIGGLGSGREAIRVYIDMLRSAFPDAIHVIDEQLAEGDKVMTRLTARGTFLGEILGYQPTGEIVSVSGISVHRVVNGQMVEHWAHLDMAGFMQQIAGESSQTDTTAATAVAAVH